MHGKRKWLYPDPESSHAPKHAIPVPDIRNENELLRELHEALRPYERRLEKGASKMPDEHDSDIRDFAAASQEYRCSRRLLDAFRALDTVLTLAPEPAPPLNRGSIGVLSRSVLCADRLLKLEIRLHAATPEHEDAILNALNVAGVETGRR